MLIKFVKGKHEGETREVSPQIAEFFVNIRREAIIIKIDEPKIQTKEKQPVKPIPKTRKG